MNTVGVLVVVLGACGIVVDVPGVALLVTGGRIEVCRDDGVRREVEAGVVSRTDVSWLDWLGFNTPGFEDGVGAGGGRGGVGL